jgi:hypothetical protein
MRTNNKLLLKFSLVVALAIFFSSCSSSFKVALEVPDKFAEQAAKVSVTGAKSNKKKNGVLRFGEYYSDNVRKGWAFSRKQQDKSTLSEAIEQTVLINFGIEKGKYTQTEKNRYQFSLQNGIKSTDVFCNEQTTNNSTRINSRVTGEINTMNRQQYSFGACIISKDRNGFKSWFLKLEYDLETPGGMLATVIRDGLPVEKGYITNNSDTIVVKPVFVKKATNHKNGKTGNFPIALLGGYEFRIGDGVAAIADVINDNIWFYNGLEGEYKMVIAAAASAILLRRDK